MKKPSEEKLQLKAEMQRQREDPWKGLSARRKKEDMNRLGRYNQKAIEKADRHNREMIALSRKRADDKNYEIAASHIRNSIGQDTRDPGHRRNWGYVKS